MRLPVQGRSGKQTASPTGPSALVVQVPTRQARSTLLAKLNGFDLARAADHFIFAGPMQATTASSHTPRLDSVASIVSISAFSASAESNSSLSIAALSCACGSTQTNNQISEGPNAAKRRRDTNA